MPLISPLSGGRARRAPAVRDGDLIGVVAPARWLAEPDLKAAADLLFGDRFRVEFSPQLALRDRQFAGSDEERARAIEAMFADPAVKAIVCAKGGYGAPRIVDALDYDLIARHPKRFVGYSDITALLLSITRRAGLETYHGPMLIDALEGLTASSAAHLIATLADAPAADEAAALMAHAKVVRAGTAEGPLIGGNLTLLVNMIGTRSDFDTAGAILFVEEVAEPLYNIDRMLVQLKRAGKLDAIAGLVIGEMRDLEDGTVPFGATVAEMALGLIGDAAVPVVAEFPCGHCPRKMTLRIGATARLACGPERITAFEMR